MTRKMCTFEEGYFHMMKAEDLKKLAKKAGVSSSLYREVHDILLSVMSTAYTGKGMDNFDFQSKVLQIIKAAKKEKANVVTNTKS